MQVSIVKGKDSQVYTNVIAVTVTDTGIPTIQIIYKSNDYIHADTIQSDDITQVGIQIVIPES